MIFFLILNVETASKQPKTKAPPPHVTHRDRLSELKLNFSRSNGIDIIDWERRKTWKAVNIFGSLNLKGFKVPKVYEGSLLVKR